MKKVVGVYRNDEPHWVGDGFLTRTVFSYQSLGDRISPFLLLDYGGPVKFDAAKVRRGVGDHPHRGFETVTVVYQGSIEHRDSAGGGGVIGPGDVQWMTAGSGIVHQEMPTREFGERGGTMEMAQLWVNLPAKHKMTPPRYQTLTNEDIPEVPLPGEAGSVRVIAGELQSVKGPAQTFTPINLWDVRLNAGKAATLAVPDGYSTLVLILRGGLHLTGEEKSAGESDLVLFEREGAWLALQSGGDAETRLLIMNGEPINEPIAGYGPFVMNSRAEIQQAFDDFRAGRFA
jgi:quercetin 2,3-dioxygenase